ncbi:hypothetical protein [Adhaeribacter aquaticus]|uniref:hypothetical protein n=1 Tax=Adhaeribacter aquaticus TaxID=299567 RepID=UPI000423C352|nr:hypothetical protein [Adhaeribacter aquaticus]
MAEQDKNLSDSPEKNQVKKPGTPKFGKARIIVPQASRDAARSTMAGEAMTKSAAVAPVEPSIMEPEKVIPPAEPEPENNSRGGEELTNSPEATALTADVPATVTNSTKSKASNRQHPPVVENIPEETKNVRLLNSLWLDAKFNLVQLNGTDGPKNLTDYAQEAFKLYEKHLVKTGKISRTRSDR